MYLDTLDKMFILIIYLWNFMIYGIAIFSALLIIQGLVYRLSHKKINLYMTGKKILYKLLEM